MDNRSFWNIVAAILATFAWYVFAANIITMDHPAHIRWIFWLVTTSIIIIWIEATTILKEVFYD